MVSNAPVTRSSPAKIVSQQSVASDVFTDVTNRLRSEPCVSFALICEDWFDFSPELDVAVRLLSIAARGRPIDHGRLNAGLQLNEITPISVETAKRAVRDCIDRLKDSGVSFEILAHVESQREIADSFSSDGDSSQLSRLADALANEVRGLSR